MDKARSTLQSRKFWGTILVSTMAFTFALLGQIDIEKAIEIIRWAFGLYVGSLGAIDAADKIGKALSNK